MQLSDFDRSKRVGRVLLANTAVGRSHCVLTRRASFKWAIWIIFFKKKKIKPFWYHYFFQKKVIFCTDFREVTCLPLPVTTANGLAVLLACL
jgi:hypothetical protein